MDQKQKIIKIYQDKKNVETFDKTRGQYAFQGYKHGVEANFLKGAIRSVKKDNIRVLDVACGTGRMLPEVFSVNKEIEYTGFDSSKEMVKYLKEKAKKLGIEKKVKIRLGDAMNLPFKEGEFDVVFTYHLLWHLPKKDQEKIIKEMIRVTKKGGYVLFDFLNQDFHWNKIKSLMNKKNTEGITKVKISDMKNISNSENIKIEKLNDFPIKNSFLYSFVNIFNIFRKVLPSNFYHMFYMTVQK